MSNTRNVPGPPPHVESFVAAAELAEILHRLRADPDPLARIVRRAHAHHVAMTCAMLGRTCLYRTFTTESDPAGEWCHLEIGEAPTYGP
jgi:hypothetical protein